MASQDSSPIFSSLSGDVDMAELVSEFVDNLKSRVEVINAAVESDNVADVTRLAHQLKGSSGGYGFAVIGEAAAQLESAAKSAQSTSEIRQQVEDLIVLCHRATAATPN